MLTAAVLTTAQAITAYAAQETNIIRQYTEGIWVKAGNDWQFKDGSGKNVTGWIKTSNGWYYVDPASAKLSTGWQTIDGKKYYFNTAADGTEGAMATGWKQLGGSWYFFSNKTDASEGSVQTGWKWIDGKCYYFDESAEAQGRMAAATTAPDGSKLDVSGALLNADGTVKTQTAGSTAQESFVTVNNSASAINLARSSRSGGSSGSGSGSSSGTGSSSSSGGSSSGSNGSNSNTPGGGSSNSGSSNNGSSNGDDNKADAEVYSLFEEDHADVVQAGNYGYWISIVLDDGYTMDKVNVTADGKNVNAALSKVTTDGSIAKLAVTDTEGPDKITVSLKSDSKKSETVSLGGSAGSDSIYTEANAAKGYLPQKVLMHGAVPVWDYHLSNLYDDGSERVHPDVTTYDLKDAVTEHKSYAPDTVIDENGVGSVEIMFNYNTDSEKNWFDGIKTEEIAVVDYDTKKDLVKNLVNVESADLRKTADVDHYGNKVGTITFNSGCANFRSNGRYYIRIKSNDNKSLLVPIQLVNETAPKLVLKESAQSGKNLHFSVENMTVGASSPVESVKLTAPDGSSEYLTNISDYFMFSGSDFVIYNDKTNHFTMNGNYTVEISAAGFKKFSKTFAVKDASEASNISYEEDELDGYAKLNAVGFDAVTTASVSGGGSGSSGSSSDDTNVMSADILFDTDLLVNAYLLESVGKSNTASEAVLDRYNDMTSEDIAFDNGSDEDRYDWNYYVDAVQDALTKGKVLSFAEYKKNGKTASGGSYAFKEVLQDGLLGKTQSFDQLQYEDYAKFSGTADIQEDSVTLSLEDISKSDYLKAIGAIYFNGALTSMDTADWSVDETKGTLSISTSKLNIQNGKSYSFKIKAKNYQDQTVNISYSISVPDGLKLNAKSETFTADKTSKLGNAEFSVVDAEGKAYSKYLSEFRSGDSDYSNPGIVKLDGQLLSVKGVYLSSADALYYEINTDKDTIILHNVKAADEAHTLTLSLNGVELKAEFNMTAEAESEKPSDTKETRVETIEKDWTGCYIVTFENLSGDELKNYIEKAALSVNGTTYTYSTSSSWLSDGEFGLSYDNSYGTKEYTGLKISISSSSFDSNGQAHVSIVSDGYSDLEFVMDNKGKLIENAATETKAVAADIKAEEEKIAATADKKSENTTASKDTEIKGKDTETGDNKSASGTANADTENADGKADSSAADKGNKDSENANNTDTDNVDSGINKDTSVDSATLDSNAGNSDDNSNESDATVDEKQSGNDSENKVKTADKETVGELTE